MPACVPFGSKGAGSSQDQQESPSGFPLAAPSTRQEVSDRSNRQAPGNAEAASGTWVGGAQAGLPHVAAWLVARAPRAAEDSTGPRAALPHLALGCNATRLHPQPYTVVLLRLPSTTGCPHLSALQDSTMQPA